MSAVELIKIYYLKGAARLHYADNFFEEIVPLAEKLDGGYGVWLRLRLTLSSGTPKAIRLM